MKKEDKADEAEPAPAGSVFDAIAEDAPEAAAPKRRPPPQDVSRPGRPLSAAL